MLLLQEQDTVPQPQPHDPEPRYGPWRISLASLKTLVALVQIDSGQSAELFEIIRALLEDKDPDIRQMPPHVLPTLVQVVSS